VALANETQQESAGFVRQTDVTSLASRCQPQSTTNDKGEIMTTLSRQIARRSNTTRSGSQFDDATIEAVWIKARFVPGASPGARRMDVCGAVIDRAKYGNTEETGTGWEIDHIIPVSRGGADDLSNLQPLQWQNNRRKGDDYPLTPAAYCAVHAAR
jgi:hypothetical protein